MSFLENGQSPSRRKSCSRFGTPRLERLEDRCVPADLKWSPTIAGNAWNEKANWWDYDTNAPALAAPTATDSVTFTFDNANCVLTADADCKSLTMTVTYDGTLDLQSRRLTVAGEALASAGSLAGGIISGGRLIVEQGTMTQAGTQLTTCDLWVGGQNQTVEYNLESGDINPNAAHAGRSIFLFSAATMNVLGSSILGSNITVGGDAEFTFAQSAGTVTLNNGAQITVENGGALDLENTKIETEQPLNSYIWNGAGGTVLHSGNSVTTVDMGIINLGLLEVAGGPGSQLKFMVKAPGTTTASVWQKEGTTLIYPGSKLYAAKGYQQDDGILGAVDSALAASEAWIEGTDTSTVAQINGGSVVLGQLPDGRLARGFPAKLTSNLNFQFAAASQLKFNIIPPVSNDLLQTSSQVNITAGAKAVLDTSNLGAAVLRRTWIFLKSTAAGMNNIVGTFTADVGGRSYTMGKEDNDNRYILDTREKVRGMVWSDPTGGGVGGVAAGVAGVTVRLLDALGPVLATTTTDEYGLYELIVADPGDVRVDVRVSFDLPSGYTGFSPKDVGSDDALDSDVDSSGLTDVLDFPEGGGSGGWWGVLPNVDAGVIPIGSGGGFSGPAWAGLDGDGVQDAGEAALAGVTVNLLDSLGGWGASTTNSSDGYGLSPVQPGSSKPQFVAPPGNTFSPQDARGDDLADPDADPSSFIAVFSITGPDLFDLDACLISPGSGGSGGG